MKKVLLTGAALVAVATSPAMAEGLKLDLSGYAKAYGVYNTGGNDTRNFDLRKETEIHFTGETTLDSGLTVGAHVEVGADAADNAVDESYIYMSGGWGRVNVGEEDGVAYLLQVAAPSADSNIDGLRQYVTASGAGQLDYDHTAPVNPKAAKVSYMTPVFSGFQAGVTYTPSISDQDDALTAMSTENDDTNYDDGVEVAVRYEGAYEGVGVAFGAGMGTYNAEGIATIDDATTYNVGLDLDFAGFGVGAAYLNEDSTGANLTGESTVVVGADYQMGAYKLGVSYLAQDDADTDRYTAGASYSYGPGMSFRGAVSVLDTTADDETQVTLGTQINF